MQHSPPAASLDADTTSDPLAKVRNPDGTVDRLAVGEAEHARQSNCATGDMIGVLDWLHANGGTYYVAQAAQLYADHLGEQIRAHGGTITTTTTRNGRTATTTRHYPAPKIALAPTRARSCSRTARPRERRASASSATSAQDPGADSDLPAPAPLTAPLAPQGVAHRVAFAWFAAGAMLLEREDGER